jgi:hypothetical protein
MDIGALGIVLNVFLHIDPACIVCNWDPATQSWVPYGAGGLGAAAGTGLGLNDLFGETGDGGIGETPGGGVGDTENPQYSDTTADDRIAADQSEQQRLSDHYRATHPGATTAGPSQPTTAEQAGTFFHRAVVKHIRDD